MTTEEIKTITKLRDEGRSYSDIAALTGLSRNTIISHFNRKGKTTIMGHCKFCGAEFAPVTGNKVKYFCSDKCRMEWWKANKKLLNRNMQVRICRNCGANFMAYKSKNTAFCSRKCYLEMVGGSNGNN